MYANVWYNQASDMPSPSDTMSQKSYLIFDLKYHMTDLSS